jgi:hypothetical protein
MTLKTLFKMGSWWLIVSLGLPLILTSAYTKAGEQADLSLTVAVPIHNGQRTIQVGRQATIFHVIIENSSEHQVNLWREWSSWGYYNLKFQFTNEKGATWIARKKEKEWEKNFPDFVSVDPRDKMVTNVTFTPDIWENVLPPDTELSTTVTMIAIYESEDSEDARKRGVWSGRLVSDKREYILLRQSD